MFSVNWEDAATDELARLCLDYPHRWADMDVAENDITYRLQKDPIRYRKEISEGLRRVISSPLAVYFSITEDEVWVQTVGWLKSAE
jgi:hypothetical protein